MTYTSYRSTRDILAILERIDLDSDCTTEEDLYRKFGLEEAYVNGELNFWQKIKPKIWQLFEEPYSSAAAKVSQFENLKFDFYKQVFLINLHCDRNYFVSRAHIDIEFFSFTIKIAEQVLQHLHVSVHLAISTDAS